MKRLIFYILLTITLTAIAADTATLRDEAYGHLEAAKAKREALETKEYGGTWVDVLSDRVADVNEVQVEIVRAKQKAAMACTQAGDKKTVQETLVEIIREKTDEKTLEQKKRNGELLKETERILADPNAPTAIDDPDEAARIEAFRVALIDVISKLGGL